MRVAGHQGRIFIIYQQDTMSGEGECQLKTDCNNCGLFDNTLHCCSRTHALALDMTHIETDTGLVRFMAGKSGDISALLTLARVVEEGGENEHVV